MLLYFDIILAWQVILITTRIQYHVRKKTQKCLEYIAYTLGQIA